MEYELFPEKERFRQAVLWISENRCHTPRCIEEAAIRFDLSPIDEDFLLSHFVTQDSVEH